jgi:hypothetical protein
MAALEVWPGQPWCCDLPLSSVAACPAPGGRSGRVLWRWWSRRLRSPPLDRYMGAARPGSQMAKIVAASRGRAGTAPDRRREPAWSEDRSTQSAKIYITVRCRRSTRPPLRQDRHTSARIGAGYRCSSRTSMTATARWSRPAHRPASPKPRPSTRTSPATTTTRSTGNRKPRWSSLPSSVGPRDRPRTRPRPPTRGTRRLRPTRSVRTSSRTPRRPRIPVRLGRAQPRTTFTRKGREHRRQRPTSQ